MFSRGVLSSKARRFALLTCLVTLLMTIDTSSASACTCAAGLPLIEQITNSSAIFSGKVTELGLEEVPSPSPGPGIPAPQLQVFQASVDISKVWKAPLDQPLTVNTDVGSGVCGYNFEVDTEYLIFAYEYEGRLYTSICTNTQPLETAGSDIFVLDSLFSPAPRDRLAPAATVTATGYGTDYVSADQLEVRLLLSEGWQEGANVEEMQQQMVDLISANGGEEMLAAGRYYLTQDGFYFTVLREELADGDFGAVMALLPGLESAVQQADEVNVARIEVRFSLQDCTLAAVRARYRAMNDARTRAELLAAQAGGTRGAILAIVEAANAPSPEGIAGLCYEMPGEWHPIPLDIDSETAQQIIWRASLSVTYVVEPRVGEATSASSEPVATPVSAQMSPLPTPTAD